MPICTRCQHALSVDKFSLRPRSIVMKLFKKIGDLFKRKPKPTDIILALEYEYEEPIMSAPPVPADEPILGGVITKPSRRRKKPGKTEEIKPFPIFPEFVPEVRDYNITLRNLSAHNTAINIDVLPMVVRIPKFVCGKDGKSVKEYSIAGVPFSPEKISKLGPGESVKLQVECNRIGSVERAVLPKILHISSDPENINDLFDEYFFYVVICFESTNGRKFEVTQEIVFRPWKRKTSMGKISRREIFDADLH